MKNIIQQLALTMTFLLVGSVSVTQAAEAPKPKVEAPASVEAADSRLDQKITYKAEKATLPKVLSDISKQTGVLMGVAPGSRFWSVRQRKVSLFIKDMPLREFMNQLETLLDYHFTRQGEPDKWVYAIWQDMKGRKKEQDTIQLQKVELERHLRRVIDETLRDAELAMLMLPEDAEKIRARNPWLAYLAGNPRGRAYAELLMSIPREKFDMLMDRERHGFSLELSELPPKGQDALKKIQSLIDFDRIIKDYDGYNENKDSLNARQVTEISLYNPMCGEVDSYPTPPLPFWLNVQAGSFGVDTFVIARSDVPMSDIKISPGEWNDEERSAREMHSDNLRALNEKSIKKDNEKPDPDLERAADYTGKKPAEGQKQIDFEMEQLAGLFGLNVMYECFPIGNSGSITHGNERKLQRVLEDLVSQYRLGWTKTGNLVKFRYQNWAERRSWEIPDEWVQGWLAQIEEKLELDFDAMVDMAARLTDAQITHNFGMSSANCIDDPLLVHVFLAANAHTAADGRVFLELYGRLTPARKAMIWSEEGLSFEEIMDDPLYGRESPTIGSAPIYDGSVQLTKRKIPNSQDDAVFLGVKQRVWLRDLSPEDRESVNSFKLQEDVSVKMDNDFVEISMSGDSPLFPVDHARVKAALDKLKQAREKAAEEKKQAGQD
ncbi:MAG: hypothetical protein Q7N50_01340 [Armatimonadota bacterium]|nr:hypothetical protein [Armatimonadota bacterium]